MISEYADRASLGGFYDLPGTEDGLAGLFSFFKPLQSIISHNKGTIGTLAPIVGGVVGSIVPGIGTMIGGAVGGIVGNMLPMVAGVGGSPGAAPAAPGATIDPETGSPVGVTLIYAPAGTADLMSSFPQGAQKAQLNDGRTLYAIPPGYVAPPSIGGLVTQPRKTAAGSTIIMLAPPTAAPGQTAAVPGAINTGSIMLLGGIAIALLLARRS